MTSYSRVRYEAFEVVTGEAITEPTSMASARIAAFSEEMARMDELDRECDVTGGFATREECAAAVDACEIGVRFAGAVRYKDAP